MKPQTAQMFLAALSQKYQLCRLHIMRLQNNRIQMQESTGCQKQRPVREVTNLGAYSKLAKRLYRNNSLGRLDPSKTMLLGAHCDSNTSIADKSMSSELIPSIIARKSQQSSDQCRYLSFNNSKIRLNPGYFDNRSPKDKLKVPKRMFRKLDKLKYKSTSQVSNDRILPDDLIDFPIENQSFKAEEGTFRKCEAANLKPKQSKVRVEAKEASKLFPEDFIQLLEEDDLTHQFCYLKKMEHPYDLKIIEFDKNFENVQNTAETCDEYITISKRGVTYFGKEQSRFMPLEEWKREALFFRKIVRLDFFRNFRVIKNFANWKKYLRKSAMEKTVQKLQQKLVYNDRHLLRSILETRRLCVKMECEVSFCRLSESQNAMGYREFKSAQEMFVKNQFQNQIASIEDQVKETLMSHMSQSMKEFKEENKISSAGGSKGMPLLIGDEKNLEMPYTKQATLRIQQQKLQKFVKLVDLMLTDSKANMIEQSTNKIVQKFDEETKAYQKQVIQSDYKHSFKGKQFIICKMTLDVSQHKIDLYPSKEELQSLFEDIINRTIIRLCRYHKQICQDNDILSIIYDNQENALKCLEGDMLKVIMTSDQKQERILNRIIKAVNPSFDYIVRFSERFTQQAKSNAQNSEELAKIDDYSAKDYEKIRILLQKWNVELETIKAISPDHEGPLILLDLKQFKTKTLNVTVNCINRAKQIIPQIFEKSIQSLKQIVDQALQQMEKPPSGVQSYIDFQSHKNCISNEIDSYMELMGEIRNLQNLNKCYVKKHSESKQLKEQQVKELSMKLKLLTKKLDETELSKSAFEKIAENEVNMMIPKSKAKLAVLYGKIAEQADLTEHIDEKMLLMAKYQKELSEIVDESATIQKYQAFLKLQVSNRQELDTFREFFSVYYAIWSTKSDYSKYKQEFVLTAWEEVKVNEIADRLEEFVVNLICTEANIKALEEKDTPYHLSLRDKQAVCETLLDIDQMKPLVGVIDILKDRSFGEMQMKQLKACLQSKDGHEILKVLDRDRTETTIEELGQSGIHKELSVLKTIVLKAKKNIEIQVKNENIKQFLKTNSNVFKSLMQTEKNRNLKLELEEKIIMANFVYEELEQEEIYKVAKEKAMLEKFKEILLLWHDYQAHLNYLEPIEKLTDWKGLKESKVLNSNNIMKQHRDAQLNKTSTVDKIILSLKQSNEKLEGLYASARRYFNNQRLHFPRFTFLTDGEIMEIKENRDVMGCNKYIQKLFPCVERLGIRQQDQSVIQLINTDGEVLNLATRSIPATEIEPAGKLIKIVEDSMRSALKNSFKICYQVFEGEQLNHRKWIHQHPAQVLVFIIDVFLTKVLEQDYLCQNGDDMGRLLDYHHESVDRLRGYLCDYACPIMLKKLYILITQALQIRDKISHLHHNNVVSASEYEWLRMVRHYYTPDSQPAFTEYLTQQIAYGYQLVALLDNPLPICDLHNKSIMQLVTTIFQCETVPVIKNSYIKQFALCNGKVYHRFVLNERVQHDFIESVMVGTWLMGSLTDLCLPQKSDEILMVMSRVFKEVQLALSSKQSCFRGQKNLILNRESGLTLHVQKTLSRCEMSRLGSGFRDLSIPAINHGVFVSSLFQIRHGSHCQLPQRIGKMLTFAQNIMAKPLISHRQLKLILDPFLDTLTPTDLVDEGNYKKLISAINRHILDQLCDPTSKQIINWLFSLFFECKSELRIQGTRQLNQDCESDGLLARMGTYLQHHSVAVIAGHNSAINLRLAQKYANRHCQQNAPKSSYFLMSDPNIEELFGRYSQSHKWKEGIAVKQLKSCRSTKCLMMMTGEHSQHIIQYLSQINTGSLTLPNGELLTLANSQKIIYILDLAEPSPDQNAKQIFDGSGVQVFDTNACQLKASELLTDVELMESISKHFACHEDNHLLFQNLMLNSSERITSSSLKMLGHTNSFIQPMQIVKRCLLTIGSALQFDREGLCRENIKMLHKMIFWAFFWSIGASLPTASMQRLERLLSDLLRIELDKTQFLGESKLSFSAHNQTVISSINKLNPLASPTYKVTADLQAKANFIRVMLCGNNSIYITGSKGKSSFLGYLSHFLSDEVSICRINITKNTSLQAFMEKLKLMGSLQFNGTHANSMGNYNFGSLNGNKLVVLIDHINLLPRRSPIVDFLSTCVTYGYFYDKHIHDRVELRDICFVCAENSSYAAFQPSFLINNFIPVHINQIDLKTVLSHLTQTQTASQNNLDLKDVTAKIIESVYSLHCYVSNIKECAYEHCISTPIWIAKEVINYCFHEGMKPEQLVAIWRYLTINQYIHGANVGGQSAGHKQYGKALTNELNTLTDMIMKIKEEDIEQFECPNLQTIAQSGSLLPLLRQTTNFNRYYYYLIKLMKSKQSRRKHLITTGEVAPPQFKTQYLQLIAHLAGVSFVHLQSLAQFPLLDANYPLLVYLREDQNQQLIQAVLQKVLELAEIGNSNITIAFDLQNSRRLLYYSQFFPFLQDCCSLYYSQAPLSNSMFPIYEILAPVLNDAHLDTQLLCRLSQQTLNYQSAVTKQIQIRHRRVCLAVKNFKQSETDIQHMQCQLLSLQKQLQVLIDKQMTQLNLKNVKVAYLKRSETEEQQRESINKLIGQLDNEINSTKRNRNEKSEQYHKIKESIHETQEIFREQELMSSRRQHYNQLQHFLQNLTVNKLETVVTVIVGLLQLYYAEPVSNHRLLYLAHDLAARHFEKAVEEILSVIYDVQICDCVADRWLLQYAIRGFKAVLSVQPRKSINSTKVSHEDRDELLAKIQAKLPGIIYFDNISELEENSKKGFVSLTAFSPESYHHYTHKSTNLSLIKYCNSMCATDEIQCLHTNTELRQVFKEKLQNRLAFERSCEKKSLLSELRRVKKQHHGFTTKLDNMLQSDTTIKIEQIKPILETLTVLNSFIGAKEAGVEAIEQDMQMQFGSIFKLSMLMYEYVADIKQLFDTFVGQDWMLLKIIQNSLVYEQEQTEDGQSKQSQKAQKVLNTAKTDYKLFQNICYWTCIALPPEDAAKAFFLLACLQLLHSHTILTKEYRSIQQLLAGQIMNSNTHFSCESLADVVSSLRSSMCRFVPNLPMVLKFAGEVLGLSFRSLFLKDRENWRYRLQQLVLDNDQAAVDIYLTGCSDDSKVNVYKLIDQQLHRFHKDVDLYMTLCENQLQENLQRFLVTLSNSPAGRNRQAWLIAINWQHAHNLEQLLRALSNKAHMVPKNCLLSVMIYSRDKEVREMISRTQNFCQVELYEKASNMCFKSYRIVNQLLSINAEDASVAKVLKAVCFDSISRLVRSQQQSEPFLATHQLLPIQSYVQRLGSRKISGVDLVRLLLDLYYDVQVAENRVILRELKSIDSTISRLIRKQISGNGINIHYDIELLKTHLQDQQQFQTFVRQHLSHGTNYQVSLYQVYGFGSPTQVADADGNDAVEIREWAKKQLKAMSEWVAKPVAAAKSPGNHEKQNNYSLSLWLLKQEEQGLLSLLKMSEQSIAYCRQIVQSQRVLSPGQQQNIQRILAGSQGKSPSQIISHLHHKINLIATALTSVFKSIKKEFQFVLNNLAVLTDPKAMLLISLLERINSGADNGILPTECCSKLKNDASGRVEWAAVTLLCRCFNQKQKQGIIKELVASNSKNKSDYVHYEPVSSLFLSAGKLDAHKMLVEDDQSKCSNKLSNSYIMLCKEEALSSYEQTHVKLKWEVNGKHIMDFWIPSRVKQLGVWGKQPRILSQISQ